MPELMTAKQKKYLHDLIVKKKATEEKWREICDKYGITKEEDIFTLNRDKASLFIGELFHLPPMS